MSLLRSNSASSLLMELCRGSSPKFPQSPVVPFNHMQSPNDIAMGLIPYSRNVQPSDFHGRPCKKNYRPRMACHQCRDRKVKCDRVKPCNACCNRGRPKDCVFPKDANSKAIDQSQEIKLLRRTNQELERRNHELEQMLEELGSGRADSEGRVSHPQSVVLDQSFRSLLPTNRPTKHKKPRNDDPKDNLYFGSISIAEVIHEFEKLKSHSRHPSVAYPCPRGVDIYAHQDASADPFPCFWLSAHGTAALIETLPPKDEIMAYLRAFDVRAQTSSFPHIPNEITAKEFEEFLSNASHNAWTNPDMLALLFATMAQGAQVGVFDKHGEWVAGEMEAETKKGDVFIAAAMHALRLSSFMNRPTLLCIQTLLLMGPYLINCGKFLDAWTLFGTTIRLAHSMGLHRHPEYLEPCPPPKEYLVRRTLWWWMLHMDQHYAVTLGRPLGISGVGDCPPPTPLTTNSTVLRFATYINQFTILARQILASDELDNSKIDDFSDRLLQLLDTLPAVVQFDQSWLDPGKEIPEWPLEAHATMFFSKTHNYLVLLNRQRQENSQRDAYQPTPSQPHSLPERDNRNEDRRGYDQVLRSCKEILKAFRFFKRRVRPAMMCWTIGQQAFNAAMVLTLHMVETGNTADWRAISEAYYTFQEMRDMSIHPLAKLACERLLELFKNMKKPDLKERVMGHHGMILLEDPGLQGFIPEKYGPLTFEMAGTEVPLPPENGPVWAVEDPGTRASKRRKYNSTSSGRHPMDDRSPRKPLDFLGKSEGISASFHELMGSAYQSHALDVGHPIKGYSECIISQSNSRGDRPVSTSQGRDTAAQPFGYIAQHWS